MSVYGGLGFDAFDEPIKGPRSRGGSTGNDSGGGGGGGGGGISGTPLATLGSIVQAATQPQAYGGVPVVLRKRGLPHIPGVTPGTPAKADTVPAMLTPGEIVMNPGVTKNPQIAAALLALNQRGAHNMMNNRGPVGMEHGGEVPGYFMGGVIKGALSAAKGLKGLGGKGGGMPTGTAAQQAGVQQPQQMAQFTPPQMQGYGGPAPMQFGQYPGANAGFAQGGMVPGEDTNHEHEGGYPSSAVRILQMLLELDEAEQSEYGDGEDGAEGHAFGGVAGQFAGYLAKRAAKRLKYQFKPGRLMAGSGVPGFALGGIINTGPKPKIDPYGYERQMSGDINAARGAGYFDPRGNQALIRGQLEGAQGTADALVRRQMTQASLGGMDPAQQAVAKQQALMQTGRGVQDIMAQTRGQALQSQDTYMKQQAQNAANTAMSARTQNDLQRAQEYRQGGFGNFVGGLAGKAIGGYIGG